MASFDNDRLNFYSKYNRVREKQDIESLYALIDDDVEPTDNLVLTLNASRTLELPEESPIKTQLFDKPRKEVSIIPSLREQEEQQRLKEMQEKLRTLQRMQRNFYEQLDRSQKEQRRKQELKEAKKKQREHYRHQLINVVQHTSEHSQHSHRAHPLQPHQNQYIEERSPQPQQQYLDDDDYYRAGEIKMKEDNDFDVKETRRKLKQIIQMQRKRQRQVESVQENNDIKTSSIVIERINIMAKPQETVNASPINYAQRPKQSKNYCEVQLSHSQSANILRVVHSFDKLETHEDIHNVEDSAGIDYEQINYEQVNLNDDTHHGEEQESNNYRQVNRQPEEVVEASASVQEQSNYDQEYEHSQINPPPTLLTHQNNHPLTGEDASEFKEEIADRVASIDYIQEQQSQSPVSPTYRSPLFFSQTRQTLQNQHEVQSIAQSLDYFPPESQLVPEAQSQIIYGKPQPEANAEPADRKTSFKKLMAQNRANLVPRLAISTILNEHINQALGDYKASNTPAIPASATVLHESIVSSQGSAAKPAKVNFKNLLRKSKMNSSRIQKKSIQKDPIKAQTNKNLLLSFFDEN